MPSYVGTDGADTINGSHSEDVFRGNRGDDTLNGLGGDDRFIWQTRVSVSESDGNDLIDGGLGTDLLEIEGDRNSHYRDLDLDLTIDIATFSLTAGAGGTAVFAMEQVVTQGASTSTARSTVTADGVETFRFLGETGEINPGPFYQNSNRIITTYSGVDHLTIGDLSGTDLTGLIEFDGGVGNDWLDAAAAINTINALGGAGADRLWTGSGNDRLDGGVGNDDLSAGDGDDVFSQTTGRAFATTAGADIMDGGSGTDQLEILSEITARYMEVSSIFYEVPVYALVAGAGGAVSFTVSQTVSNDLGFFTSQVTSTVSNTETLRFVGSSAAIGDPISSGGGDQLYTPVGDDRLTIGDLSGTAMTGLIEFDGGSGNDWLDALAATNQIHAVGGAGHDWLWAGSHDDILSGGDSSDTLIGGGGSNLLDGGAGAGRDRADYRGATQSVIIDLNDGTVSNNGYGLIDTLISIEELAGGDFNDILIGEGSVNHLLGRAGADYLIGLGGDDILEGGTGAANTMQGGLGDDLYVVSAAGDSLIEYAGEGTDMVHAHVSFLRLRDNFEDLTFMGSGAFTGIGNALGNRIIGRQGADTLIGLEGNDYLEGGAGAANTLIGGLGDDFYRAGAVGDTLVEQAGEGHDTVEASVNVILRDNFEDLRFVNGAAYTGTGNALANSVRGASQGDTLIGMGGDDVLEGLGGDDRLRGGVGADILDGGAGVDIADFSDATASITIKPTGQIVTSDTNVTSDTLISIEGYIGSAFNDTMLGNAGVDIFDGGLGADVLGGYGGDDILAGGAGAANTLVGGNGNDIYRVSVLGDTIVEYVHEGFDTVETALGAYTLRDHLEGLRYTGAGAFTGTGNAADNRIEGGAGNDVLIGRGGADRLEGGLGQDTIDYSGSAAAVTVRLDINSVLQDGYGGQDTLLSVENATGSAFNDALIGSNVANVLNGGAGADSLVGYAGDDVLIGGSGAANVMQGGLGNDRYVMTAADTLVENAGEGTDTVETTLTAYTLRDHFENLTYTGAGAFAGTGNALNNVLTGAGGADTFTGLQGNDAIHGGGGTDTVVMSGLRSDYVVTAGGDHFTIQDNVGGRDGLDSLYVVERIRFSDGEILDLTAPPGPSASLAALFDSPEAPHGPVGDIFLTAPDSGGVWDGF